MQPSLPDNEVHLWLVDLDAAATVPDGALAGAEQERAQRIRDPAAGRRWATSRWALREVLGRYLERAGGEIELTPSEHGKPALSTPGPLEFNLSHSGGLALVAIAGVAVGVDIEQVKPERDFVALARRALEAGDVAAIEASPPPRRAATFYAAWTRHEARLKCGGGGFGGPAPATGLTTVPITVADGYAAAYAVAGERPRESRYRLDLR